MNSKRPPRMYDEDAPIPQKAEIIKKSFYFDRIFVENYDILRNTLYCIL